MLKKKKSEKMLEVTKSAKKKGQKVTKWLKKKVPKKG